MDVLRGCLSFVGDKGKDFRLAFWCRGTNQENKLLEAQQLCQSSVFNIRVPRGWHISQVSRQFPCTVRSRCRWTCVRFAHSRPTRFPESTLTTYGRRPFSAHLHIVAGKVERTENMYSLTLSPACGSTSSALAVSLCYSKQKAGPCN